MRRNWAGLDMISMIGFRFLSQGNPSVFDFHSMEGSGFKPDLYSDGQNSDLYRHIYSFAGGSMLGNQALAFGLDVGGGQVHGRTAAQVLERQLAQDRLDAQG